MVADRVMAINALDRDQLLQLARSLAAVVMMSAPDEAIEADWKAIYKPIWTKAIEDMHKDQ